MKLIHSGHRPYIPGKPCKTLQTLENRFIPGKIPGRPWRWKMTAWGCFLFIPVPNTFKCCVLRHSRTLIFKIFSNHMVDIVHSINSEFFSFSFGDFLRPCKAENIDLISDIIWLFPPIIQPNTISYFWFSYFLENFQSFLAITLIIQTFYIERLYSFNSIFSYLFVISIPTQIKVHQIIPSYQVENNSFSPDNFIVEYFQSFLQPRWTILDSVGMPIQCLL